VRTSNIWQHLRFKTATLGENNNALAARVNIPYNGKARTRTHHTRVPACVRRYAAAWMISDNV
jgi:hypothetical protein